MYSIKANTNYRGEPYHVLIKDGVCLWTINPKDLQRLVSKGIAFNDSEAIEQFMHVYNL